MSTLSQIVLAMLKDEQCILFLANRWDADQVCSHHPIARLYRCSPIACVIAAPIGSPLFGSLVATRIPRYRGRNSMVECRLSKPDVASSTLAARSS